jgi:hypothetical protein
MGNIPLCCIHKERHRERPLIQTDHVNLGHLYDPDTPIQKKTKMKTTEPSIYDNVYGSINDHKL